MKRSMGPKKNLKIKKVFAESPFLILRKPETVGVDDVLDTTKFGSLRCDRKSKICGAMSE